MSHRIVAWVALAFTAFFAFLTLYDAAANGVTVLTVASVGVLALFAFGILGALWQRPPDE